MCPGRRCPSRSAAAIARSWSTSIRSSWRRSQLSVMDVVRTVNDANLILPAGDVKIGPYDYNLYTNSQIDAIKDIDQLPLKTVGDASVLVGDVGASEGRLPDPEQHRAGRRPAVRLSAGHETGRRRQHHRRRRRHQGGRVPPGRRARRSSSPRSSSTSRSSCAMPSITLSTKARSDSCSPAR